MALAYALEDMAAMAGIWCALGLILELSRLDRRPWAEWTRRLAFAMIPAAAVIPMWVLPWAPAFTSSYGVLMSVWKLVSALILTGTALWGGIHFGTIWLASGTGVYAAGLFLSVATINRFEPARGAWPDEWGSFVLVLCFAALMVSRGMSMARENRRLNEDLQREVEKQTTQIQADMLPSLFPAFPERQKFDIYATMTPAKEVGGDFYDFFMVDDWHLAIVMADVSGKGVPAALFMVIGKTLIKDHTLPGVDLGEVFTQVNELLCKANKEGLFITAFKGVLDLVTGELRFVNAGHEPPFLCPARGRYAPYKTRPGFVLAGMEGMVYRADSVMLSPGDKLFQYTDGVTEATRADQELYGMERLQAVLDRSREDTPHELLPAVKADIDAFVGEAEQFDDITMLCVEFKSCMKEERGGRTHE